MFKMIKKVKAIFKMFSQFIRFIVNTVKYRPAGRMEGPVLVITKEDWV